MVGFNVLATAANLWPGGRRQLGAPSSDGRMLHDLLAGDADAIAEERSGWYWYRPLRAQDDGDLDGPAAWSTPVFDGSAAPGRCLRWPASWRSRSGASPTWSTPMRR